MHFFIVFVVLMGVCVATIGTLVFLGDRSFKKALAEEDAERLIPFPIHGSRVMLTNTEYATHLDDQLDTANAWAAKLLRDTED